MRRDRFGGSVFGLSAGFRLVALERDKLPNHKDYERADAERDLGQHEDLIAHAVASAGRFMRQTW